MKILSILAFAALLLVPGAVMAQQPEQSYTVTPDLSPKADVAAAKVSVPEYAKPFQGTWMAVACPSSVGAAFVINGEYTQLVNLATSPSEVQAHIGAIATFSQVTKGVEFTYQNLTNQFLNFKLTAVDGKLVGTFTIQDLHGSALITAPVTFVPNTPAYKGDLGMFLSSKEGTCSAK